MDRPHYRLLLSGIPAMREVAAVRTRAARDAAMKRANTPEERSSVNGLYYDEVRENRAWFDEQEAFLLACIAVEEGKDVSIPRRVKRPMRHIIRAADYESTPSPIELLSMSMQTALPPEVQAIMGLIHNAVGDASSAKTALIIGQVQAMIMTIYARAERKTTEGMGTTSNSATRVKKLLKL